MMTDKQLDTLIAEVRKVPRKEFSHRRHTKMLDLCKVYLRKYHQLHEFTFHLSPQVVPMGMYVCNRPPCV